MSIITVFTLFTFRNIHNFSCSFSKSLWQNPTENSCNEGQTAHDGEWKDGIDTSQLNDKWRTCSSNATGYGHHAHSTIPENYTHNQIVKSVRVSLAYPNRWLRARVGIVCTLECIHQVFCQVSDKGKTL